MNRNIPIPKAAADAGMTRLVLCDDFDSMDTIDLSGEGKPGYTWYTDRPYHMDALTAEDLHVENSVLYLKPRVCPAAIGLPTYSCQGATGFKYRFGYAEARIRVDKPTGKYNGVPAFWGICYEDFASHEWEHAGELDILEVNELDNDGTMSFTGTIHDHWRPPNGEKQRACTNLVNALGYQGKRDYIDNTWHTYAALWDEGYVAWYMDGKLMHSARYAKGELPQYFYRDDPCPLPRIEHQQPSLQNRTWEGGHTILNTDEMVLFLGCNYEWPMEVDWVHVWQK